MITVLLVIVFVTMPFYVPFAFYFVMSRLGTFEDGTWHSHASERRRG